MCRIKVNGEEEKEHHWMIKTSSEVHGLGKELHSVWRKKTVQKYFFYNLGECKVFLSKDCNNSKYSQNQLGNNV